MPNICDFDMHVKGKTEDVQTLLDWLSATYEYDDKGQLTEVYVLDTDKDGNQIKRPVDYHIGYRVFDAWNYNDDFKEFKDVDNPTYYICGNCAWSVYSCMFATDGFTGYMSADVEENDKSISIVEASRRLNLTIEIFSSEEASAFCEHFLIDKGKVTIDDCTDLTSVWLENEDYTYEQFIKEYGDFLRQYNDLPTEAEWRTYVSLYICPYLEDGHQWEALDNFTWLIY